MITICRSCDLLTIENYELKDLNAKLVVHLRGALHHVENEGDDTLATMIRAVIAKAEVKS